MADILNDDEMRGLSRIQHDLYEAQIPLLVIFEGNSGTVNGRVISEVMNVLEPRGVRYRHFDPLYEDSPFARFQLMYRGPAKGNITIYDRSWYAKQAEFCRSGRKDPDTAAERIRAFERYLVDNGVYIIKFFLKASNLDRARSDYDRSGKKKSSFLDNDDISADGKFGRMLEELVERTDSHYAPWIKFDAEDPDQTFRLVMKALKDRMERHAIVPPVCYADDCRPPACPNPRLDADLSLVAEGYKKKLRALEEKAAKVQRKLAESDRSVVMVFEGWDAAGKGGSIKRLAHALNPRGYKVVSSPKPTEEEYTHTYLWRFMPSLPRYGKITIFDRSWYGRMMVEPIEGFCTEEEYARAANEINGFEKGLIDCGCIVMKFWVEISKEEQLRRFEDRQNDPLKNWKITDEDWRNREKWDVYEDYVNRMMETTNTPEAPWIVVESEDKKYARLKVLKTFIDVLEKELD